MVRGGGYGFGPSIRLQSDDDDDEIIRLGPSLYYIIHSVQYFHDLLKPYGKPSSNIFHF
jgi:hypothetical protein